MTALNDDDRYLTLKALSEYSSLSIRTLQRAFTGEPPLPRFKVGDRVLVRRSDFDRWLAAVGTQKTVEQTRAHGVAAAAAKGEAVRRALFGR